MTHIVCKCGKGYESQWDMKCGHCRTKEDIKNLEKMQANSPVPPGHIRIVYAHLHQPTEHDVQIGTGSVLANPFGWVGGVAATHTMKNREEAKEAFHEYLIRMVSKPTPNPVMAAMEQIIMTALEGKPVKLVCTNKDCHAEVIKDLADQIVRQQLMA